MNKYIVDTMALVLRLEKRRMPALTKRIFENAEKEQAELVIPSIALFEIGYLFEKKRMDTSLEKVGVYSRENETISEAPLDFMIISTAFRITDIPELHDRMIAGYGLHHNTEIITNDPIIAKSSFVKTLWN